MNSAPCDFQVSLSLNFSQEFSHATGKIDFRHDDSTAMEFKESQDYHNNVLEWALKSDKVIAVVAAVAVIVI
ncbi:Hypothetical predicted protein [Octopus vulgaris]|uniref:Uncharacterized protein n=1 Tax=Octopus vulgaris TaxID=6645 RepID=A0AA36AF02_OCTVU|nr:Hypothetical predicted protein [Octopus vulgaris]